MSISEGQPIGNLLIQHDSQQKVTRLLPPYKLELFRDKIVSLGLLKSQMDDINIWWRTIDSSTAFAKRADLALSIKDLPKEEKEDIETRLKNINPTFEYINLSLNSILTIPKTTRIKELGKEIISLISPKKEKAIAKEIDKKIQKFEEKKNSPSINQIIAFCEAFQETNGLNDTKTMRMKVSQWAFEEMIALFPRMKFRYQYNGIPEPTTVDQVDEEKSELVNALKSELWTPEETKKWQNIYEQNRKNMGKFRFEKPVKDGFEYIFRSALGEVSAKYSAIYALAKTENVFQGIRNDSTLQEYWDYEAEQEEEKNSDNS
jgi:hypothetical protein